MHKPIIPILASAIVALWTLPSASAQLGYVVNDAGDLLRFNLLSPGTTTLVRSLPFAPEGFDFRPRSAALAGNEPVLYLLDVGPVTTQLYTFTESTNVLATVGAGFPSQVVGAGGYDLVSGFIGFDFNPRTLQMDGSIRIRVTADNGTNLRLNSDTGIVAAVDTPLQFAAADPNAGEEPSVTASAYINNSVATLAAGGATTLYGIDDILETLVIQNPPNGGTLNTVGNTGLGFSPFTAIGFDIFTDPASNDDTIGGDTAYAIFEDIDADSPGLYRINLATGAATELGLFDVDSGIDPELGFALRAVPEPTTTALLAFGTLALLRRSRSG